MKNKVMIIEDNCYKFFTTKQILEAQLKLEIEVIGVKTGKELVEATAGINPDQIIYRPDGGVADLLMKFRKRNMNRRNTTITIVLANELDDHAAAKLDEFIAQYKRGGVAEAA